jgi:predicted MFS family arabinose efflux permease
MPSGIVGSALCILGGGEVLGGLIFGRVVDRLGVRTTFVLVMMVELGGLALA